MNVRTPTLIKDHVEIGKFLQRRGVGKGHPLQNCHARIGVALKSGDTDETEDEKRLKLGVDFEMPATKLKRVVTALDKMAEGSDPAKSKIANELLDVVADVGGVAQSATSEALPVLPKEGDKPAGDDLPTPSSVFKSKTAVRDAGMPELHKFMEDYNIGYPTDAKKPELVSVITTFLGLDT